MKLMTLCVGLQNSKQRQSHQKSRESSNKPMFDQSEMPPRSGQMMSHDGVGSSQAEPLVPFDKIEQIMEKVLKMSPKYVPAFYFSFFFVTNSKYVVSVDNNGMYIKYLHRLKQIQFP